MWGGRDLTKNTAMNYSGISTCERGGRKCLHVEPVSRGRLHSSRTRASASALLSILAFSQPGKPVSLRQLLVLTWGCQRKVTPLLCQMVLTSDCCCKRCCPHSRLHRQCCAPWYPCTSEYGSAASQLLTPPSLHSQSVSGVTLHREKLLPPSRNC